MSATPGARRLLALGGGGFTSSVEDWPLDEFAVGLARRPKPRVCLLPTASGDPADQIERFYRAFDPLGCELSHVSLFRLGASRLNLREHLLSRDVVYVGGGSMLNLLALWRVHEVDALLTEAWAGGVALVGVSAGAMCWFAHGVTRTHGAARAAPGLGLLPGSLSVHDGSDRERRDSYRALVSAGAAAGYAVDDGVGLVFAGGELVEAVTARANAGVRRVELSADGVVVERPIEARLLESRPSEATAEPTSLAEFRELAARRRAG